MSPYIIGFIIVAFGGKLGSYLDAIVAESMPKTTPTTDMRLVDKCDL